MRVVIIEDEPLAREGLRTLLAHEPDVEVIGAYGSCESARTAIRARTPDAIFVDVEMPGGTGLDLASALNDSSAAHGSNRAAAPLVVVVTAHDKYATRAFDVDVVDYVLKPVDEQRLALAVERLRCVLQTNARAEAHGKLVAALGVAGDAVMPAEYITRLSTRVGDRLMVIRLADVSWIEADGDYMRVHTRGKSALVRMTMSDLERRLDPRAFLRAHRSALVNIDAISIVELLPHGENVAVLADGSRVRLGRTYKAAVLAAIGERG